MLRALLGAALLASAVAQAVKGSRSPLIQALENAPAEDEARSILGPHLKDMKTLEKEVVELVVMRQWWTLARELVSKSHEQKVRWFRFVQERRSPSPGTLYKYFLSINLFDNIEAQLSNWNAASDTPSDKSRLVLVCNRPTPFSPLSCCHQVGKLSVTLRKRWARKWPRLLSDKKTKVSNMHMWMEMQEKLDSSLSGFSSVSNSPITCAAGGKLYCVATDTCKKSENCSQCPGKTEANEEVHLCAGKPSEKASLTFQDSGHGLLILHFLALVQAVVPAFACIRIRSAPDLQSDTAKLENADGKELLLGEVSALGNDLDLMIPQNSPVPEGATHLLVFSRNAYGEYATPGSLLLRDAALPKAKPGGLTFEDEDGGKDLVRGRITISRAADEEKISEYSLHWGRSPTRKTSQNSFISAVRKEEGKDVSHWLSSQKPPEGATHLLAFSKWWATTALQEAVWWCALPFRSEAGVELARPRLRLFCQVTLMRRLDVLAPQAWAQLSNPLIAISSKSLGPSSSRSFFLDKACFHAPAFQTASANASWSTLGKSQNFCKKALHHTAWTEASSKAEGMDSQAKSYTALLLAILRKPLRCSAWIDFPGLLNKMIRIVHEARAVHR
eukprot:g19365.t1